MKIKRTGSSGGLTDAYTSLGITIVNVDRTATMINTRHRRISIAASLNVQLLGRTVYLIYELAVHIFHFEVGRNGKGVQVLFFLEHKRCHAYYCEGYNHGNYYYCGRGEWRVLWGRSWR